MGFNLIYWNEPYMRLILFGGYFFGKMWKNMEKRPFFQAAMAGLVSIGLMYCKPVDFHIISLQGMM